MVVIDVTKNTSQNKLRDKLAHGRQPATPLKMLRTAVDPILG